jgi:hypothetical protein
MKSLPSFLPLLLGLLVIVSNSACYSSRTNSDRALTANESNGLVSSETSLAEAKKIEPEQVRVSLQQADDSDAITKANERKIIRSATLALEVASPTDIQWQIGSIAASLDGFVVTSESKHVGNSDSKAQLEVTLVLRVPADQFDKALGQIRATGGRVVDEKITGQDVTEEFIDLEARLKTQKALENQFVEIMKQAGKISDALEVQSQIANVRAEVERLEGRRRFLQNRASLSTINVTLRNPAAIAVNTSGFGRSVKDAIAISIDLATGIVLLLIRLIIVSIPIILLVVLPAGLVARYFVHRARRLNSARGLET